MNKEKLDSLYERYNHPSFVENDPVRFIHRYSRKADQEVAGFVGAMLAFGQRTVMIPFIERILGHLGDKPYNALIAGIDRKLNRMDSLVYRFIRGVDIRFMLYKIHRVLKEYGSLEGLFREGFSRTNNLKSSLIHFVSVLNNVTVPDSLADRVKGRERQSQFLISSPSGQSACKRLNLFLRWMVRKDCVDMGLWHWMPRELLLIPVDTHVARLSRCLSLTMRKNPDWKMAEEITNRLKEWSPDDPVKYDLALFGSGVHDPQALLG